MFRTAQRRIVERWKDVLDDQIVDDAQGSLTVDIEELNAYS